MSTTPKLAITNLAEGQAGAEFTINDALAYIDAAIQITIVSATTTPPGSPTNGQAYLVTATATGAWAGKEKMIAAYYDGWRFLAPVEGWTIYNQATNAFSLYSGSAWQTFATGLGSDITDSSTGSDGSAVGDVGGSFSQATLNNNFHRILKSLNEVRTTLRALGFIN